MTNDSSTRELRKKRTGRDWRRAADEHSTAVALEPQGRTRIGARIAF